MGEFGCLLGIVLPAVVVVWHIWRKDGKYGIVWPLATAVFPPTAVPFLVKARGPLRGTLLSLFALSVSAVWLMALQTIAPAGGTCPFSGKESLVEVGAQLELRDTIVTRAGHTLEGVLVDSIIDDPRTGDLAVYVATQNNRKVHKLEHAVQSVAFYQEPDDTLFDVVQWTSGNQWRTCRAVGLVYSATQACYLLELASKASGRGYGWFSGFRSVELDRVACPACRGRRVITCNACDGLGSANFGKCSKCCGKGLIACEHCEQGYVRSGVVGNAVVLREGEPQDGFRDRPDIRGVSDDNITR